MNQQPGSTVRVDEAQGADQIELRADMSVVDDQLQIRYEVTNRSPEPIVLLNFVQQPMAEPEQDPDRVFVEAAQPDGTVVITQRALVESVPSSKRPLHRAVMVDAGDSLADSVSLPLPLRYANPEAPKAGHDLPDPPERVQLCLGYVPAARFDTVALEQLREGPPELRPISPELPPQQSLLCSEVQRLT